MCQLGWDYIRQILEDDKQSENEQGQYKPLIPNLDPYLKVSPRCNITVKYEEVVIHTHTHTHQIILSEDGE